MSADLNFESEPYGAFSGPHPESEAFETVVVRDHRGGGAPVISGTRGGYATGPVVRDHRGGPYGGVAVARAPGGVAVSSRANWPWGGRGTWRGLGGWAGRGGRGISGGWGAGRDWT